MASNHAAMFISKALDGENAKAFEKHGIDSEMFVSKTDKQTYEFVEQYRKENGQMPSYAVVVEAVSDFNYIPGVTDSFEYLANQMRTRKAQIAFNELMSSSSTTDFINENKDDMEKVISKLTDDLGSINSKYTNIRSQFGLDIKKDTDEYLSEYRERQEGKSFKTWQSAFPYINEELGGYSSGNLFTVFGKSGRGKSAIVLREALEIAQQGATVLLWSLEMPGFEVLTRLYTMLSAKLGMTTITVDGEVGLEKLLAGFDSSQMRNGQLSPDYESKFTDMLEALDEHIDGTIIVRGVDDEDFEDRTVKRLRQDIEAVNADFAIVDPFYYLDYSANKDKTTGGAASETSKQLRKIAGSTRVPIIAMTQGEEDDNESSSDEIRELELPKRKEVKTTKSLMQDAAALIAIDTNYLSRRGLIGIKKGRNGGEGTSCELTFLPNYGVIEQLVIDASDFDF